MMNLSIKNFFISIAIINLLISILAIVYINLIDSNSQESKKSEFFRFQMIQKADELRQSSDDLTHFVRAYAATSDKKYKLNYFTVLDIRKGKTQRPENYQRIYWDLLEPVRSQRHPLKEKSSLKKEMNNLPFTTFELDKLYESKNNSNELVNIEIESMQAISGVFKDVNGNYTINAEPNKELALKLLYSKEYLQAKHKIMLPIDEFLASVDERTLMLVNNYNKKVKGYISYAYVLFFIDLILLFSTFIVVRYKILAPISNLSHLIKKFKNGDKNLEKQICFDDEIGLMTQQFFNMKNAIDIENNRIQELIITDELTGLYNRKYFNTKLAELLSLYKRHQTPFSIIMYDIDNFKAINDTYGHPVGDKVLIEMSDLVKSMLRENDFLFRIGGEEFIILLANSSLNGSKLVAEKVRHEVSQLKSIENHPISISLGLTGVEDGDDDETVLKRVDDLLYHAKHNGKNKVSW